MDEKDLEQLVADMQRAALFLENLDVGNGGGILLEALVEDLRRVALRLVHTSEALLEEYRD